MHAMPTEIGDWIIRMTLCGLEIFTALKRQIRVMRVLVDDAVMPRSTELPEDLQPIVRRQAVEVSHIRFATDQSE
jgi:hypothetical protein